MPKSSLQVEDVRHCKKVPYVCEGGPCGANATMRRVWRGGEGGFDYVCDEHATVAHRQTHRGTGDLARARESERNGRI